MCAARLTWALLSALPSKDARISFTGISNINSGIACCVALLYFGNIKRYGKYNLTRLLWQQNV